jgi:hypothetical protein
MMGRTTGFHSDKARGHLGEEDQDILAPEHLGNDRGSRSVNTVNVKNMLGQITANGRDRRQVRDNLCHGRRSFSELLNSNHLGTALIEPDAGPGAVHIINLTSERRATSTPMSQIYAAAAVASFQH